MCSLDLTEENVNKLSFYIVVCPTSNKIKLQQLLLECSKRVVSKDFFISVHQR